MSRDFILILGGGVVSLLTTLVVLFVSDYIYRRDELLYRKSLPPPPILGRPIENAADVSAQVATAQGESKPAEGVPATVSVAASEVQSET